MHYHVNIVLTDEDYLDFSVYQNWDSPRGKRSVLWARIVLIAFSLLLLGIGLWRGHFSLLSLLGQMPMMIVAVVAQLLLNQRLYRRLLCGQLSSVKKRGKPSYDPTTEMAFFDDMFTECIGDKNTERSYADVERITFVEDRMIYLHTNKTGAYLLPRTAFESDEDFAMFAEFMIQQCPNAPVCKTA